MPITLLLLGQYHLSPASISCRATSSTVGFSCRTSVLARSGAETDGDASTSMSDTGSKVETLRSLENILGSADDDLKMKKKKKKMKKGEPDLYLRSAVHLSPR